MDEQRPKLSIPVAIVVAGLIVGVAVIFTAGGGSGSHGQQANVQRSVLGESFYTELATSFGVDEKEFEACVNSDLHAERVQSDLDEGVALGITGTPTSFILAENGEAFRIRGALTYEEIAPIVEDAIAGTLVSQEDLSLLEGERENDHVLGNPEAPVTLIEYSDLECPFCARFHPTAERIVEDSDGQVKWIYRHFPLSNIHPQAGPAAIAAECVADLGGNDPFWKFIDQLFKQV